MGQLEFGREQGLFQQREVASEEQALKNVTVCPNRPPSYLICVIKQTILSWGCFSFVKSLTP